MENFLNKKYPGLDIIMSKKEHIAMQSCIDSWEKHYLDAKNTLFSNPNLSINELNLILVQVNGSILILSDTTEKGTLHLGYNEAKQYFIDNFQKLKTEIEGRIKIRETSVSENPYPQIFKNAKGWNIFEIWKNDYITNELADYCFIYWKLKNDKLMCDIMPWQYKEWLFEEFQIEKKDHWKQLWRCTTDRKEQIYHDIKRQLT